MFQYHYISDQGVDNLKHYAYHGVDRSIIAPYLQKWWMFAINYMPMWVAPNLITLTGFFGLVFSCAVALYHCPQLAGAAPSWVYLFHFLCLFLYQTMDALDGKQARRTKTSSPLGELFDHGCDAVSVALIGLTIASTLQLGYGWSVFCILVANYVVFYLAQWEEYHTGVLELGYLNVTEAQLLVMSAYLWTAWQGPQFWTQTFTLFGMTLRYNVPVVVFQMVGVFVTMGGNLHSLFLRKHHHAKHINHLLAITHLIPVVLATILAFIWGFHSPNNIFFNGYSVVFILGLGFLFPNMVGRIVVARVCKDNFTAFQPLLLPLVFGTLNALTNESVMKEEYTVWIFFLIEFSGYLHYALCVINQMCTHLKIRCLHIPHIKQQ